MEKSRQNWLILLAKTKSQLDLLIEAGMIRIKIPGVLKSKTEQNNFLNSGGDICYV